MSDERLFGEVFDVGASLDADDKFLILVSEAGHEGDCDTSDVLERRETHNIKSNSSQDKRV